MFKKLIRKVTPNPLDRILKKAKRRNAKTFLLGWNRGLGDIALGLYAIVHRIRTYIPDAKITFLIRENLQEGFSLFPVVKTISVSLWKRGEKVDFDGTLKKLNLRREQFDVIIEKPDPTYWVAWQRGKLVPKLHWKKEYDVLYQQYALEQEVTYIGMQPVAETNYGTWRNWPIERYEELIGLLEKEKKYRVLLFGFEKTPTFSSSIVCDLRGATNLFSLLSIIKNCVSHLILPDSGISSMTYYLNEVFDLHFLSLWADPRHGILKQNVKSPNPKLIHTPMVSEFRNLSSISASEVFACIQENPIIKKINSSCTPITDAIK